MPLKAGRAASQLAETAQAATRPSSQAVFPPAHDVERAVRALQREASAKVERR